MQEWHGKIRRHTAMMKGWTGCLTLAYKSCLWSCATVGNYRHCETGWAGLGVCLGDHDGWWTHGNLGTPFEDGASNSVFVLRRNSAGVVFIFCKCESPWLGKGFRSATRIFGSSVDRRLWGYVSLILSLCSPNLGTFASGKLGFHIYRTFGSLFQH